MVCVRLRVCCAGVKLHTKYSRYLHCFLGLVSVSCTRRQTCRRSCLSMRTRTVLAAALVGFMVNLNHVFHRVCTMLYPGMYFIRVCTLNMTTRTIT